MWSWVTCAGQRRPGSGSKASSTSITWRERTSKHGRNLPEQDIEVTRQVALTCLARNVKRLIYTGTIDSYYAATRPGTSPRRRPGSADRLARICYARAKAASEEILLDAWTAMRGLPRGHLPAGNRHRPRWAVRFTGASACGRGTRSARSGAGEQPAPLVFVQDVASALVTGLRAQGIEGESFNLVADSTIVPEITERPLEKGVGVSFQKISTPPWKFYAIDLMKWAVKQAVRHPDRRRPSLRNWESRTQRARYDCSKARQRLNWRPVNDPACVIRRGIRLPASEFLA